MLPVIFNEMNKLFRSKKIFVFGLIIIIMSIGLATQFKTAKTVFESDLQMLISLIIPVFSIYIIGDHISDDYKLGTLKLTMIQPVSRKEIIIGKAIFDLIALFLIMLFTFGLNVIICLVLSKGITITILASILSKYLLTILPLFAFSTLIIFMATLINSGGALVAASFGVFIGMQILNGILREPNYIFITNYFDMFMKDNINVVGIISSAGYIIIFLIAALLRFENKDIVM
jgi:ABC-2 type transport system permease protein